MNERDLDRWAGLGMLLGGLAMTALFLPFTLTHGPTSINEGQFIGGLDMHGWGFALGVIPNVLIAAGLWICRSRVAGGNRTASIALSTICVVLLASAAMDLAFQALGPPFSLFVLAPAMTVAAWKTHGGPAIRGWLAGLAFCLWFGLAMSLVPLEVQDPFDGYRITGAVMYGVAGVLWAGLGVSQLRARGPDAIVA